jgi:hypothetical protein
MKKRLILITTILAIVSGVLFADVPQQVSDTTADPAVTIPAYTPTAASVSTAGNSTTVVADADNIQFVFAVEAKNGTDWVPAASQEVYDADWNVRDTEAVSVDFRVRAIAGTAEEPFGVKVTVGAGKLTRVGTAGYVVDKAVVIGTPSIVALPSTSYFTDLDGSAVTAATGTPTATSPITFKTVANHFYGLDANAAGDSVNFNITYTGDANAPAGRYKSIVTVGYAAN